VIVTDGEDEEDGRMADRAKITDLWGDYGAGNDQRDFGLLESCFTEDASFTVHIADGGTVGPFQPRKDVMEFFRAALGPQAGRRRTSAAAGRRPWTPPRPPRRPGSTACSCPSTT
jgi:SnoaL-like protein